ncbi:MAG: TlpA family protein disulfide reductase [Thermoanaerobaculia bacterium]|nr:TlpA family protein disulfide reductase [Thermoanaerobaculia bacterium]
MSDSKRPVFVLVAAALAAAAAAWFAKDALIQPAAPAPGSSSPSSAAAAKRTVPAGPLLVLGRGGTRRDLAAKTGKGLILHFWATWCAPCREEMPELVKFVRDTKDDPRVEFLAVSADEGWKVVDAWLREGGISGLPVALDPKGAIAGRYGVTGYPETFFIAPSGEIVQHVVGPMSWSSPKVRTFAAEFSRLGE